MVAIAGRLKSDLEVLLRSGFQVCPQQCRHASGLTGKRGAALSRRSWRLSRTRVLDAILEAGRSGPERQEGDGRASEPGLESAWGGAEGLRGQPEPGSCWGIRAKETWEDFTRLECWTLGFGSHGRVLNISEMRNVREGPNPAGVCRTEGRAGTTANQEAADKKK